MDNQNQQFGSLDSVNIEATQPQEKKSTHVRTIAVVVLVLVIALFAGYLAIKKPYIQEKSITSPEEQKPIKAEQFAAGPYEATAYTIQNRKNPWIEVVKESEADLRVGDSVTILIKGSSGGKDVTGYDVLIGYDKDILQIGTVTTDTPDYEIFKFEKNTHMTVTGIKDFQKKDVSILDNTTLLKLTFTVKQKGKAMVSVFPSQGKENTQFVDAEVKVVKPQIGSLELEVK